MKVEIAQPTKPESAATTSSTKEPVFKTRKDRVSYALGVNLGNSLRKRSLDVDSDILIQGIRDVLTGGQTLMNEEEVQATLLALHSTMRTKQAAEQAGKTRELAAINLKQGQEFLAINKATEGIVTLESGLQYKALKQGDGQKPTATDTVVCHYRGILLDGSEFDSSYKRQQPATFALNKVIKGWNEALQLMSVGSKWQLFIPPSLAYGMRGRPGTPGIGPNATLIFEVELMAIQDKL
jgi:FKBP-type peptidyl-prolyl cis-trans isomerase FklB